ncbi:unnamed protein product [Hymenolepis diminuta]|uniref:TIR domain-containing protein n=1 Tax=Hymenolepis diminuta TaxID=6216 RepID=A0A0R3SQV6_HYMDI|nr:unnamed protein product [Hymenolepis diminuta]
METDYTSPYGPKIIMRCADFAVVNQPVSESRELKELRILDVSTLMNDELDVRGNVKQLLEPETLPNLRHFDISGNPFLFDMADVLRFIQNHPKLKFLGLAAWSEVNGLWSITQLSNEYPNIEIIGGEGEEQFIKTIQRYSNREIYVKYVLHVLSQNLFDGFSYTPNILECVVNFLEGKRKKDRFTLIALLVMSQLTDSEHSSDASATLLERVRDIILPLMEDDETDSDRLYFGQDVLFNLIRTGRVALDYKKCCKTLFKNIRNTSVSKVKAEALATLILLFEKMSDDDLVEFRTNIWYMQCLIKCAAENYLIDPIVHQWLDEVDDGHLSYLRNFDAIYCDHVSYSELFRLFIQGDFRGCVIFAEAEISKVWGGEWRFDKP